MTLTREDVDRLRNARVLDLKGEAIGRVDGAHVLAGELVGVKVRLDGRLAALPTVERDVLEVSPRLLDPSGEDAVRMRLDLMDAVGGRVPTGGGI